MDTGIIGLAASEDIIQSVSCSNSRVDIQFKKIPSPDKLDGMFPESALLVVDGSIFGSCDVGTTLHSDVQIDGVGFLSVQTKAQNGATVSLVV